MESITYKSPKTAYNPSQFPHISYISSFPSNSFYMCLGVGIIELVTRFKNHEDYIRGLLRALENRKAEALRMSNENSQYVQTYYNFIDYINTLSPLEGFLCIRTYIESPSQYNIVQSIEKGFRYILASMYDKSKSEKINKIIAGENIDSHAYSILLQSAETFSIKIERYKIILIPTTNEFDIEKDDFTSRNLGKYPIIHLALHNDIYYLAYSQSMVDQENQENFDERLLDDYPFLDKQRDLSENKIEQSILESMPDESDSKSIALFLVKNFARELKKTNLVNKEIVLLVQECLKKNPELGDIEELRSLTDFFNESSSDSSLKTKHIIKKCSFCKKTFQSDLNFNCPSDCSICFICRKSNPYYCLECSRCYNKQELNAFKA